MAQQAGKRADLLFLFVGILIVTTLACSKGRSVTTAAAEGYWDVPKNHAEHRVSTARKPIESELVVIGSHSAYVSCKPVSNDDFHRFVQETRYRTSRQRKRIQPDWEYPEGHDGQLPSWQSKPDSSVRWLDREDAEAYCVWLSTEAGQISPYLSTSDRPIIERQGFRLASSSELDALEAEFGDKLPSDANIWEWTHNSWADFQKERSGADAYLTAWKSGGQLRHRRQRDLQDNSHGPTSFRVAWTKS